jgi:hypothetical protein
MHDVVVEQSDNARRSQAPAVAPDRWATGLDRSLRGQPRSMQVVWLQRQAGNRAVSSWLRGKPAVVQRCCDTGGGSCACKQDEADAVAQRQVSAPPVAQSQAVVQRQAKEECTTKLIGEDDWVLKGRAKTGSGYDTGSYYKDVAREILETGETKGIEFDRGLFIVAQARAEQGMGDPKRTRFRVLNLTVPDAETKGATRVSKPGEQPEIFETKSSGRKFSRLRTTEFDPVCSKLGKPTTPDGQGNMTCSVTSAFYVYDSIGDQTKHYLDEMTKGRPGVMEILKKTKGTKGETADINDFGTALKGYGSNPNYAADLCHNYNAVATDVGIILDQAIQTKEACLKEAHTKRGNAWTEFDKAHKEHAAAHAAKDQNRIARAVEEIRRVEQVLAQLEKELKWLDEAIVQLKARRAALKTATCPSRKKPAAPAAP